jgi:hypothetical protein
MILQEVCEGNTLGHHDYQLLNFGGSHGGINTTPKTDITYWGLKNIS